MKFVKILQLNMNVLGFSGNLKRIWYLKDAISDKDLQLIQDFSASPYDLIMAGIEDEELLKEIISGLENTNDEKFQLFYKLYKDII